MALQVPSRRHQKVELQFPIEIDGEKQTCLYVMRPRGFELRLIPAPTPGSKLISGDYHPFAAKCCGIKVSDLEKLEAEDYQAVMEAAQAYAQEFPPTGSSAAPSSPEPSTSDETKS